MDGAAPRRGRANNARLFLLGVVTLVLAACQTSNVRKDFDLDSAAASALIVGSVTQPADAGLASNAYFYVNFGGGRLAKELYAKETNPLLGYLAVKNEFHDPAITGRIFVIELPPGTHSVDRWMIKQGEEGYGFTLFPKSVPPALEFRLEPGQIMYLGNFHMDIESGKNMLGFTIPVGGAPEVRNESARDIALFRERYPQFATRAVSENVLHSGRWASELENEDSLEVPKSQ